MQRILLATNNPGKVREFDRILAAAGFSAVTPAHLGISLDVDEPGLTYEENAILKARAFAGASGLVSLADDSGVEVDALGGAPGVRSARYGGPSLDDAGRVDLMLSELAGVPAPARTARYRAVVAVAWPGGEVHCFEGVQEGSIGLERRGAGGFGYDPIFVSSDGRTNAELTDTEKDAISHRGAAVRAAAAFLAGRLS
ncbi:MAG TPA: RdgB/HAM1 family non-canonical purine NTP pyrophosphatase [Tepidiformaceae bacterium]|nr:RdgB/HAM1 family non-canonical purine NTP pyrophosphatase [Tepidiformaceae bacterium]